jgi:hypothetical protein
MRTSVQRILALSIVILIFLPATSLAQTRRRPASKPARPNLAQQRTSEIQRQGALRVAEQIKVLTRFIYLLGGVAKTLEGVDDAARRSQTSGAAVAEQTQRSRTVIRNSIRDVRVGLDKLEIDFRGTPELERFYVKLAGVAAGAATAEDQAAANQFDKAGRSLLDVVNRLTDALLEM